MTGLTQVLYWITVLAVAYFLVLNGTYLATSLLAFSRLRRYGARLKTFDLERLLTSDGVPPVTLIAPAYNEEAGCVESVRAFLSLSYPDVQILVVNDGSKDATLARLIEAFDLVPAPRVPTAPIPSAPIREMYRSRRHPNLLVLDKENGGKADALNAGLAHCRTPLFCAMDADTLLERDALLRVVRPFIEDADTVAVGGIIRIVNGCRVRDGEVVEVGLPDNLLARFQVLEYLRAFLAGRMGWDALDATLIISGAFGLFRRSAVVSVGGYATDTVGEDMELVVRLHRVLRERGERYAIRFVPDPVAWTECPETLRVLGRQRDRWQRGLAQSLMRHRRMLLNPRYGRVGMIAYPFFFFLEMLGPLVELAGWVSLPILLASGRVDLLFATSFLAVSVGLGMVLSVLAVALEELSFRRYPRRSDLFRLFGLGLLENVGYRQLQSWWRLKGLWSAVRGSEAWGAMERKGFSRAGAVTALIAGLGAAGLAPAAATDGRLSAQTVGGSLGVDRTTLSPSQPAWTDLQAQAWVRGARGTGLLRLTRSRRFGSSGEQAEVELYPVLGPGRYAYLGVGGSGADFYPELRLGAEWFQSLGGGWEGSAGIRHFRFDEGRVTLWTGSAARYVGDWWLSARPYLASGTGGTGVSATLTARLLASDGRPHLQVTAGVGDSPEVETAQDLLRTRAFALDVAGWIPLAPRLRIRLEGGAARERFQGDSEGAGGLRRTRLRVGAGIEVGRVR